MKNKPKAQSPKPWMAPEMRERVADECERLERSFVCDDCGHFISIHGDDGECYGCPENICQVLKERTNPHINHGSWKFIHNKKDSNYGKFRCVCGGIVNDWKPPEIDKWETEFMDTFYKRIYKGITALRMRDEMKDFIRQLLAQERQAVIEELGDIAIDITKIPFDEKMSDYKWFKTVIKSVKDQIIAKLKPQEFHRCKCGAISSWNGCFCQRKGIKH